MLSAGASHVPHYTRPLRLSNERLPVRVNPYFHGRQEDLQILLERCSRRLSRVLISHKMLLRSGWPWRDSRKVFLMLSM